MKLIDFFATRADLEPGLRAIENQKALKLVRINDYPTKGIPVIESLSAIPDLGQVTDRRSPDFLVLPASKTPRTYRIARY